jgi:hypothetical protein
MSRKKISKKQIKANNISQVEKVDFSGIVIRRFEMCLRPAPLVMQLQTRQTLPLRKAHFIHFSQTTDSVSKVAFCSGSYPECIC